MGEIKDKRLELLIEEVNIFLNNDQLFEHCLAVAKTAEALTEELTDSNERRSQAFIAGLLHDIGGIYPNDQLHRISIGKSYGRVSNKNFIENLAREYHLDLSDKQGLKYPANFDVVHQILTVNL